TSTTTTLPPAATTTTSLLPVLSTPHLPLASTPNTLPLDSIPLSTPCPATSAAATSISNDLMDDPSLTTTLELLSEAATDFDLPSEVISAATTAAATGTNTESSPLTKSAFWSQTMDDLFAVDGNSSMPRNGNKKKRTPVVVHRVLTSDEILQQKAKEIADKERKTREKEEKAKAREESRQKRAQAAAEKRKAKESAATGPSQKKAKRPATTSTALTQDRCILCLTAQEG
ncbi:hypothetical protein ElyMa_001823600, partial [Elysia marginata]